LLPADANVVAKHKEHTVDFAKKNIDVGLFTNRKHDQFAFWEKVAGLPFDHSLKLGGGLLQHRFVAHDAVIKVNDARDLLPVGTPPPISRLLIASPSYGCPRDYVDPDGNAISLVPPGHDGVTSIALQIPVADIAASSSFYQNALGLQCIREGVLRCGDSLLFLTHSSTARPSGDFIAQGLRYFTLQVQHCDTAHAAALAAGAQEGRPPTTLGQTARVSFVISPDGLWIELSERASLTGRPVTT
jgi:catechol 2,3-dioxygenase-like lactoylglutathione lyase family enzyme